jgi:hypothetical protein
MLRRLREAFFGRFLLSLALLVGVMQVVVGHWAVVVVAGHEGPGWALGLVLAALLVAANGLLLPVLRRARRGTGWPRQVARAYVATGLVTLLLGVAVLLSWAGFLPLRGVLSLLGIPPEAVFQGFRLASGGVVTALAGMLLWGFTGGQARIAHSHVRVPLRGLSEDHDGLRIVQISDLHIGNGLEGPRLDRLVGRVNALEPDLVAVTGDIFDFDPRHVEDGARRLAGLRARLGVFAVLGNHDTYTGTELVARCLAEHAPGLRLLRGELVRLPAAAPLYLAGVDDPGRDWTGRTLDLPALGELAGRLPGDGPVVLLVHRPEAFPQAARLGFPLVLAGHTHGGQLALPGRGGRHNLARLVTRFPRGLYRDNGSLLYVNRGVGVAGPAIRFNCPREIATIELLSA